jgi:hypothetical protein
VLTLGGTEAKLALHVPAEREEGALRGKGKGVGDPGSEGGELEVVERGRGDRGGDRGGNRVSVSKAKLTILEGG